MNPISPAPNLYQRPASGKATASLALGIIGLVTGIPSMLAVVFGHLALTEPGRPGYGRAVAGLALGYTIVAPLTIVTMLLGYLGVWEMLS
jgi:hypothetical protein